MPSFRSAAIVTINRCIDERQQASYGTSNHILCFDILALLDPELNFLYDEFIIRYAQYSVQFVLSFRLNIKFLSACQLVLVTYYILYQKSKDVDNYGQHTMACSVL